jgi:hypothetical protein
MLASDKINVYTAARSEELIEKQAFITEEITPRLKWVSENLPESSKECYSCFSRQRRRALLV